MSMDSWTFNYNEKTGWIAEYQDRVVDIGFNLGILYDKMDENNAGFLQFGDYNVLYDKYNTLCQADINTTEIIRVANDKSKTGIMDHILACSVQPPQVYLNLGE